MNDTSIPTLISPAVPAAQLIAELAESIRLDAEVSEHQAQAVLSLPLLTRHRRQIKIGCRLAEDGIELNDLGESFRALYLGGMDLDDEAATFAVHAVLAEYGATLDGHVIKGQAGVQDPAPGLWAFIACLLQVEVCALFRHHVVNAQN